MRSSPSGDAGRGRPCTLRDVEPAVIALAIAVALTSLAATRASRWYVTGGFTTFIVILLLVYGIPNQAQSRFVERVAETLLGVSIALLFGVALPAMKTRAERVRADRGSPRR